MLDNKLNRKYCSLVLYNKTISNKGNNKITELRTIFCYNGAVVSLWVLCYLYFVIGDASHWYNNNISYFWQLYSNFCYPTICPRHRTNRGNMWIYQQNTRHVWWLYAQRIQFCSISSCFCQIMEVHIKLYCNSGFDFGCTNWWGIEPYWEKSKNVGLNIKSFT